MFQATDEATNDGNRMVGQKGNQLPICEDDLEDESIHKATAMVPDTGHQSELGFLFILICISLEAGAEIMDDCSLARCIA